MNSFGSSMVGIVFQTLSLGSAHRFQGNLFLKGKLLTFQAAPSRTFILAGKNGMPTSLNTSDLRATGFAFLVGVPVIVESTPASPRPIRLLEH